MADAKAGLFGSEGVALLIEDLERFSRAAPATVLPRLLDDLVGQGITLSLVSKGRDISSASLRASPMQLIELVLEFTGSNAFSERLSTRISHVHQAKRERIREGKAVTPASAPAWIDLDGDGRWVLNDYAPTIRRLLAMAAEGHGCHVIATTLNGEGVLSPGQYRRDQWEANAKRRSKETYQPVSWNGASVKQVIANPAVIGHRQVMTPGYKQRIRDWQQKCADLTRQGVGPDELPKHPVRTYEPPARDYYPPLISEAEQSGILLAMQRRRPACAGQVSQVRWIGAGLTFCICGAMAGASCSQRRIKNPDGQIEIVNTHWLHCKARKRGDGCTEPGVKLEAAQANLLTRVNAETFLALIDPQKNAAGESTLAKALTATTNAQTAVDQITAAIAAGQQAMANESDAAVLGVLARLAATQEQTLATANAALKVAQAEVHRLQSAPSATVIAADAQQQIRSLLKTFAAGLDAVDTRRAVQHQLQRLGARIHLDGTGQRLGIQIGDADIQWDDLAPQGRLAALQLGMTQPAVVREQRHRDGGSIVISQDPISDEVAAALLADAEHHRAETP